ncbi:MAG: hypothetical protein ABIE22_04055 [archaeon]
MTSGLLEEHKCPFEPNGNLKCDICPRKIGSDRVLHDMSQVIKNEREHFKRSGFVSGNSMEDYIGLRKCFPNPDDVGRFDGMMNQHSDVMRASESNYKERNFAYAG